MTVKVTIVATSTDTTAVAENTSNVHMDVKSILQVKISTVIDRIPTVVTITE
jgi:hypothetical protein